MIGFIKGKIVSREEGSILVENNGIGYEINVPDSTQFYSTADKNEEITVYTMMLVREDDISLCGFRTKEDLNLFKKLLTVNGVGSKAALALLSVLKAGELSRAIVFEDTASITRAPGIGKKTALRIVLELKDKLGDISGLASEEISFVDSSNQQTSDINPKAEALQALIALGYSKSEAGEALSRVKEEFSDSQDYIKQALSKLM